jgi:hypothetical protein
MDVTQVARNWLSGPHRWKIITAAAAVGAAVVIWAFVWAGWLMAATGLTGVTGMAVACVLGLAAIRALLAGSTGIAGVARAVIDEAVRMRAALVLLVLLVLLIPTLPLVLDHDERLQYRVQFLLAWALGGTGLILSLLTIFLACGSICGDIESSRIHTTLAKPLHRWEYLAGKWLGIVLFNLLLVALAGAGTATFVGVLARTQATDQADRDAVDRQVLTARAAVAPAHDRPEEYEAAIVAAIRQLEQDDPDGFSRNPAAARGRVRSEFAWAWHTITPDMVSTFVFGDLVGAKDAPTVQLQLKPRVNNVDIDLADVRFALWLNGRPWPMVEGVHHEQTLPSLSVSVLDLPTEFIDDTGTLKITFANRNLVPAGETRPTEIQLPPGDGLRLLYRTGGFEGNLLRCLAVMWCKLALVAAAGVAAAAMLGFPTAVLLSLVIYFGALGGGFLRDALGIYNVVAESFLASVLERLRESLDLALQFRFYEAGRMLLGFVTDVTLRLLPAFSDYDAVGSLATGLNVPARAVLTCFATIGLAYPLLLGLVGWLVFDRRDLVRPNT